MHVARKVIGNFVALIFLLLTLDVTLQVFARAVGISMPWTEEVARFLFIWLVFLGGYLTIRKGINIAFDLILSMLPKKGWTILFTLINIISCGFLVLLGILGSQLVQLTMSQLSPILKFPMGIVYLAIPIGAAVMILAQIEYYFTTLKKRKEGSC